MSDAADLDAVEATVADAIRRKAEVRLLGHGEISIVVGWPTANPVWALKRVPPFATSEAADGYAAAVARNFELLAGAGVSVWPTELVRTTRADGRVVVYHRQPIADTTYLGTNLLRAAPDGDPNALAMLDAIVAAAIAVCRPGSVGFDVQAANWLWDGTTATQIDFTSPFLLKIGRAHV